MSNNKLTSSEKSSENKENEALALDPTMDALYFMQEFERIELQLSHILQRFPRQDDDNHYLLKNLMRLDLSVMDIVDNLAIRIDAEEKEQERQAAAKEQEESANDEK